jgi:hypothetical protein
MRIALVVNNAAGGVPGKGRTPSEVRRARI